MSEVARCAHCDAPFVKRRADHRFCRPEHRKLGERKPYDPPAPDHEQVRWLFDPARDPGSRAAADDWHPGPPEFAKLDTHDTLAKRRRWYGELRDLGQL